MGRGRWIGPVGVFAVTAKFLVAIPPANADCVYVDFYVTKENASPMYPAGDDACRYSTSWPTVVTATPHFTHQGGKPDGTPNGFHLDVRIPLP